MKRISHPILWLGLILSCTVVPLVLGQDNSNPFHANAAGTSSEAEAAGVAKPSSSPDVPAAALLTNEGQRLAQQLLNLRRSEASMGASHPSLGGVRAEIEAVKKRLATFAEKSDANQTPGALPKSSQPMTADQLRELVLQMSAKIDQLERRIFVLERQLGTIEQ